MPETHQGRDPGTGQRAFGSATVAVGALYLTTHSLVVTLLGTAAASLISCLALWRNPGRKGADPVVTLPGPVSAGPGRVQAVPALADGRHDLGDPGVEGVKFFRLGRAGDERTSVTQDA